jgi:hypothetical protein
LNLDLEFDVFVCADCMHCLLYFPLYSITFNFKLVVTSIIITRMCVD